MNTPATSHVRWARRLSAGAMLLCLCAMPAAGGVYKCQGDDGRPIYQDGPCAKGRELRDFDKDPPTVSILPSGVSPGASTASVAPPPRASKDRTSTRLPKSSTSGNPADRKFLSTGLKEGEVIARIGRPDVRSGGKSARWTYLPVPGDPHTVTTLTFDQGRLVDVERKVMR